MSRLLIGTNETTGVETWAHFDHDRPGNFVVESTQDCEAIMDNAHSERVATTGMRFGDLRKVGDIPPVFLGQMMRDGSINDPKALRKFFADNPAFKTFDKTW